MYLQSQYSFKHPWSVQKKNISTFVGTCKIKQGIHIHSCSHIIRTCIHVRVYIYNYYLKALFCFIELCDIWRKKTPNINKALLWITHLSFHIFLLPYVFYKWDMSLNEIKSLPQSHSQQFTYFNLYLQISYAMIFSYYHNFAIL